MQICYQTVSHYQLKTQFKKLKNKRTSQQIDVKNNNELKEKLKTEINENLDKIEKLSEENLLKKL